MPPSGADPESAANAFFATLEQGNPRDAYEGSAFAFQTGQTFDGFLSNAEDLGLIGGQPPKWAGTQLQNSQAILTGTLVTHAGAPLPLTVTMTSEGGVWKLFALKTTSPNGTGELENRFTVVGTGAGFNDVYHQPMPGQTQLDMLVHRTLAKLNDGIQQQDFHAFYDSISQQWKDGRHPAGVVPDPVTPKIFKNHFQGFIDNKIDLAPVALLPPIYDAPPHIDENGYLDLQGHLGELPNRVEFSLQFAYELPAWKLVSISIGIRR